MTRSFDRAAEDVGNIVALEHVNVQVPDQGPATLFYVSGLGLTRDPYMMTGIDNMWVNVGRNQFHLPTGKPQRLRGIIGLVIPDRDALLARLRKVAPMLAGSLFGFTEHDDAVEATCPWGNRIRCHAPDPRFGGITLGMPYVQFDVPQGSAAGIAAFYAGTFGVHARTMAGSFAAPHDDAPTAQVPVGVGQWLLFRETAAPVAGYDGNHIQIYVADFSGPHRRLLARGLVSEESNQHQYRFVRIADPASDATMTEIEHEVRSMRHPMYARPLVNRNPAQTNRAYAMGHDAWIPGIAPDLMDDPRAESRRRAFEGQSRS
mgnify:CR=1 FL=1